MDKKLKITIDATTMCNRGCKHCDTMADTKNVRHFTPGKMENLLNQLEKKRIKTRIGLTGGGEPFLNPDIVKLSDLAFAYPRLSGFYIITSGFLVEDEENDLLVELAHRDYYQMIDFSISFSLFNSTFPQRLRNMLDYFKRSGADNINIKVCMTDDNSIETSRLLHENLTKIEFVPYLIEPCNPDFFKILAGHVNFEIFSKEDYDFLFRIAHQRRVLYAYYEDPGRKEAEMFTIVNPQAVSYRGRAKKFRKKISYRLKKCSFIFYDEEDDKLHLDSEGNWYPSCDCSILPDMRIGNLSDDIDFILERKREIKNKIARFVLQDDHFWEEGICDLCQEIRKREFDF